MFIIFDEFFNGKVIRTATDISQQNLEFSSWVNLLQLFSLFFHSSKSWIVRIANGLLMGPSIRLILVIMIFLLMLLGLIIIMVIIVMINRVWSEHIKQIAFLHLDKVVDMRAGSFTILTEIKVRAHRALVSDTNNRHGSTSIAGNTIMKNLSNKAFSGFFISFFLQKAFLGDFDNSRKTFFGSCSPSSFEEFPSQPRPCLLP